MAIQRRIVEILLSYDELIENCQQRFRVLESMVRAIYRESLIASGTALLTAPLVKSTYWKFITANVAHYEGSKRYFATADIDKLVFSGDGIEYAFCDKPSRAQKQPTVYSVWFARMKNTYKIAYYCLVNAREAESSILSSGFAGFQAVEPCFFPLLFLSISSAEFHAQKDRYCTGATQMSLTNEGLDRIEVPIPDEFSARRLGHQAMPLIEQMLLLQNRIRVLSRTRDLLLPRLLSGQIDVDATETLIEETIA